jgi:predicted dehydrogenase
VLRIGLLGASRVASYAIIEPARARADVQVTAVASRDLGRAQEFAAVHGIPSSTGDYRDVIESDEIDLVYMGLPPSLHREWAVHALEAGKPVLCEKPFALNAIEALAMTRAAAHASLPLLEAFHYRWHGTMLRALEITRNVLVRITSMRAVVSGPGPRHPGDFRWHGHLGGGALLDLGCYGVHALRTIAGGEPEVHSARMKLRGSIDTEAEAHFTFPGCPDATVNCSFTAPVFTNVLKVVGERGTLEVSGFMQPQLGGGIRITVDRSTSEEPLPPGTTYATQLEHVVAVLAGQATAVSGGADAVSNMLVLDRIREIALR